MESGYVKFFDTRGNKLFGFVVDGAGNDLFFHFSGGHNVVMDADRNILFEQRSPMQFPMRGDELMFERGRNSKGPKATVWCFQRDYARAVEKRMRKLTLEEAKQLLANATANVLEYTDTTRNVGITTIETISIVWSDGAKRIATGTFVRASTRYQPDGEDYDNPTMAQSRVSIYSPDLGRYHDTDFKETQADELKELGSRREVRKGEKQCILWNGGWDDYVVDPNSVRDMTPSELEKIGNSSQPTFEDEGRRWLRCLFAKNLGHESQAVRVIVHLGGGD